MASDPLPAQTAPELKGRIEAEREGRPFLVYRDADGDQVIRPLHEGAGAFSMGRSEAADVSLDFDREVSHLHAELGQIADDWVLIDDGLSRNGSFVNGDRVVGRRRLRDGDALRFGNTVVVFRCPGAATDKTETSGDAPDASTVTDAQRGVLIALCRPFREGSEFAAPASNRQIAEELFLSVDAVKAHMRTLFERFEVGELPQNQKRIRLAELAIKSGVISPRDLES